ncbi:hypothetical protein BpHYR1_046271 [Brachionus plicatilis]|uniref:Uncharacterized protein n=1 Tax=Brachionus plicatilis TaxID=10195 RepID=A0A3M7Q4U9_BRAPC|nr:hypothetical protein BpHYR1_046271 [Brachionus plicatilis]
MRHVPLVYVDYPGEYDCCFVTIKEAFASFATQKKDSLIYYLTDQVKGKSDKLDELNKNLKEFKRKDVEAKISEEHMEKRRKIGTERASVRENDYRFFSRIDSSHDRFFLRPYSIL